MDREYIEKRMQYLAFRKKQLLSDSNNNKIENRIEKTNAKNKDDDIKSKIRKYLEYRELHHDKSFYKKVKSLIDQIPDSNGCRYYEKRKVNIGIVADEFLYNSYKDAANLIYITPDNYKENMGKLDLFLVVSTWNGLNNEWKGVAYLKDNPIKQKLIDIIELYKKNNIKVVFYSKEDPPNYDIFINIAKKCDYIFTTAEEKISDYKKDCKTDKVYLLEFGINPMYHNPIGFRKFVKGKEVIFSGSWYKKYPERIEDSQILYDGVIESNYNLKIIDRNFHIDYTDSYHYPKKYIKYISPGIKHNELQKVHKLFNWAININTIKYSQTMLANRVYELQALGNILLSNYSVAVNNKFPNVFTVINKNEVKSILESFSDNEIYRHQILGIRRVMTGETTFDRVDYILNKIGLKVHRDDRKVAIIVNEKTKEVKKNFERQSYKNKELLTTKEVNSSMIKEFDMVTFFADDKEYEEFYLEDMINAFKYTKCDFVTKDCYYDGDELVDGVEHDYVNIVKDKYRTVFWTNAFNINRLLKLQGELYKENGYSIDRFEFNNKSLKRHNNNNKKYELSVIIPTYNNGDHLLGKCFNSLKRSSIFEKMEIIIVDDGSTDGYTPIIIDRIRRQYSNVKTYYFNDGGSGSASRPRNKGIELSSTRYITYLDPDNEAINDGYYKLYSKIINNNVDFVVGNVIKLTDKSQQLRYYKQDIINDPKNFLISGKFNAQSIQALIVKKELLTRNELQMVEGALGEDTLFFQELMLNSNKVGAVDIDIHIYYAQVVGSETNTINKMFFMKYKILEIERIKRLNKYGIINEYKQLKFEYYFKRWYLEKLKNVKIEDAEESIDILFDIYKMYDSKLSPNDVYIKEFIDMCRKKDFKKIIKQFIYGIK